METRSNDKLFLLDFYGQQIIGAKLPSIGQVLQILFYNIRKVNLNLRENVTLFIKEIFGTIHKSRIPVKKRTDAIKKLESIYQKWRNGEKKLRTVEILFKHNGNMSF